MHSWIDNQANSSDLFVGATNAQTLRAQRVWRLVIVLWCTWLFFAGFLHLRGYERAAQICVLDSIVHGLFLVLFRKHDNYRRIMNLNLLASAFGLFFVSLSHPAMAGTMLFYPVSILVASQLLGVRDAFLWTVITVVAFGLFFLAKYGQFETFHTSRLDELVLLTGVGLCVFFCCQQGEEYYQLRTKNLIDLSYDLQKKSEILQRLATTDALTGITNRFQFQEKLKEAVDRATDRSERVVLFLLDMDGFKEINDTLGHPVGDAALVEIASRLRRTFGSCSEVARLGGDEFCIIYPGIQNEEHAAVIANRICKLLTRRYCLAEAEFCLGVSVGFAFCPDHTTSELEMLAYADTAMFHAKEKRLSFACYEREMTNHLVAHRQMQEKLSHALERQEFFLEYQPQVDIRSDKVVGVEALLRWRHEGEVIPPYRFISLLEQSREIVPVGKWIVEESCRQLAEWRKAGFDVAVSVNISAVQFEDPKFCPTIARLMQQFDIEPGSLDCEITEGLLIKDVQQATDKLTELKELGITISVDDFGTGYSSLAYLRQFPIDRLKIDRAFIKDIPDSDDGQIATSIIVLSKALGMKVLAEGVETETHLQFLKDHDCDEYQGYFRSRPVSPQQVAELFSRSETAVC